MLTVSQNHRVRCLVPTVLYPLLCLLLLTGCSGPAAVPSPEPLDLLLHNGRIYTFSWGDPAADGTPSAEAPFGPDGWSPDAEAVGVRNGEIVFVGSDLEAEPLVAVAERVVDLDGATVLPGFVDSHAHASSYGGLLSRVNLVGVENEAEAVERIELAAAGRPEGEWIVAWGFDEGLWADRLPTKELLSERVPNHPVHAAGLHGFATWENQLSLDLAGITGETTSPVGGEILLGDDGEPNGSLLNNASDLYDGVIPGPNAEQTVRNVKNGLQALAQLGFTGIHDAGVRTTAEAGYTALAEQGELPIRAYLMLSITDESLIERWLVKGPMSDAAGMLQVRAVKAYYDGSLGARGARLLEDYSDRAGHRGVSGGDYGFDQDLAAKVMEAGFQLNIHAIGDAGNRETLDFFQGVYETVPSARSNRNRIEHAQIVHPDDQPRFADLEVIASMEPPHAVEDKTWAEDRLGPARILGGYAWRSLRQQGARLAFNSDLSGSDPNLFYGLHSAITRRDKQQQPEGGWYVDQAMTAEEAIRGYTVWNAFAGWNEDRVGVIAPGYLGDLTITDIDPLVVGDTDPGALLKGVVTMTVVNGRVVFEKGVSEPVAGALYSNPLVLE